jgi:transcription elongation factor GreA-like protein
MLVTDTKTTHIVNIWDNCVRTCFDAGVNGRNLVVKERHLRSDIIIMFSAINRLSRTRLSRSLDEIR